MFYMELSGTPYEMGFQHGRARRLSIASMIDFLGRGVRDWDDAQIERARQKNMSYTEKRCPELLEETQGVADGSGFPYRSIYLINFYAALVQNCSNIIFTNTPDGPIHARTTDLPQHEGKHSGVALRRPKGKPAALSIMWPGCVWLGPAVSETGLSIGGSSCATCLPTPKEFLNPHVAIAYIFSRCETVKDAIKVMGEFSGQGWGSSYAFLDKTGDAAIIEKAGDMMGVRRPIDQRLWCANAPISPELKPFPPDDPPRLKESAERYETIGRIGKGRPAGVPLMKEILAFNEKIGAVSHYGEDNPLQFETECAQIMRPRDGVMEVCFSKPDRDPWQTFSITGGWREADGRLNQKEPIRVGDGRAAGLVSQ